MRTISLINHLEFRFSGSVVRKGIAFGDVDNDGNYELIVGNEAGHVVIFKGLEKWQTIKNLGFVSCVVVGDILNRNRNCLVIVTADGWCYIYSVDDLDILESFEGRTQEKNDDETETATMATELIRGETFDEMEKSIYLRRIHVQRIPPNTKDILLGDIDGDGLIEMVVALTDRVVRSYRWTIGSDSSSSEEEITEDYVVNKSKKSKLVALNKWECAQQIGSISLHHAADGVPSLLVAQPGGTFMRIHHQTEQAELSDQAEQSDQPELPDQPEPAEPAVEEQPPPQEGQEATGGGDSASLPSENLTGFSVDYQFLGISRMRNPNISTEIVGDLRTIPSQDSSQSDKASTSKPAEENATGRPYAVATLDGTIMLVQDEIILWAIAVDHQLFALTKLDVTGNGADEIVVCSWDGHTYILDQYKNTVRFLLGEPVQAFETGLYTLIPGNKPVTCFAYVTFKRKILLYFDIPLKQMVIKKFVPNLLKLSEAIEDRDDKKQFLENLDKQSKEDLIKYLLYGVKFDKLFN